MIGGDGSLTGADIFRHEWSSLLEELIESGKIIHIMIIFKFDSNRLSISRDVQ